MKIEIELSERELNLIECINSLERRNCFTSCIYFDGVGDCQEAHYSIAKKVAKALNG